MEPLFRNIERMVDTYSKRARDDQQETDEVEYPFKITIHEIKQNMLRK